MNSFIPKAIIPQESVYTHTTMTPYKIRFLNHNLMIDQLVIYVHNRPHVRKIC